ncbi:MAG: class I SAM-dependent DNA methyltransferase [Bacteroidales bacterium]|nr:class I SAM-dependent DNA methyltransferase [Bacteroidales bacterium]
MKTEKQIAAAAAAFAERWQGRGYERGESQLFWADLLTNVYGVENLPDFIRYEERVSSMVDSTNFIDGHIPSTRVLIEQKSIDKDLRAPVPQSEGGKLTPFQQAKKYVANMPLSQHPKWIVTCNFAEFLVYDMEQPNGEPEQIFLKDLGKEYYRLQFLVDVKSEHITKEMQVSMKAGEIVGRIYEALLKQYDDNSPEALRWLNILCVRIVFCLYAEDAGVFRHDQFHDYLNGYNAEDLNDALLKLFNVLNTPLEKRSKYLKEDLKAFPYTNGGLFEEAIEIPQFTEELKQTLLQNASLDFDWSEISPTIFGAVFESTLNPETRRSGGMHYTSIENIHKVIDPLFLNDLRRELDEILEEKVEKTRLRRLDEYQAKLASLTFLDPACGSGNFLTETYLSLRRLENEVIRERYHGQSFLGFEETSPVKVSIHQFYGIEINDFAVTVATTALWISEAQMLTKTEQIVQHDIDFLPLKSYANIVEGNALRVDWNEVVPAEKLDYIMGNPPFVEYAYQSKEQKEDLAAIMKGFGSNIDYVAGWYLKSAEMMAQNPKIRAALVSTNSITQGEQVAAIWKPLFEQYGVHFDFAYRTFRWDSEADIKAHVHCVILGFSVASSVGHKIIYLSEAQPIQAKNINGYLLDAPDVFIENRKKPLCDVPEMIKGSSPVDGGNLIIEAKDYEDFVRRDPNAKQFIKRMVGSEDFIHNKERFCLWLQDANPAELRRCPLVMERIEKVREMRLNSTKEATRRFADYPTRFMECRQPKTDYLLFPRHSSESRRYIPIGYVSADIICNDSANVVPSASLYHFGVLVSNVHNAWMRAVCGRLEMRYRYSNTIVYNNFPWPNPTEAQKTKIEQTAQAILDARAKFPDCSLADLYDEAAMTPELRRAHQENDRAVMQAYGFPVKSTFQESECVAELFRLYQGMVGNLH